MKSARVLLAVATTLSCGGAHAATSIVKAGYLEQGGGAFLFLYNNSTSKFDDVKLLSVGGEYPGESEDFGPVASMDLTEGFFGNPSGAFSADYDDSNLYETVYKFSAEINGHIYLSEPFSPSFNSTGHYVDFLGLGPQGDHDFDPVQVASLYLRPDGGSVPEPATWALMLLGWGGVGAAMRMGRRMHDVALTASASQRSE